MATVDGGGSRAISRFWPEDLGDGPGAAATDTRTPELGNDLSVLKQSKITMLEALDQLAPKHGPMIEAKFELDHDGKLALSVYPVGKGIDVDAERNTFFELAGDPTAKTFSPKLEEFKVPDEEHLTRSSRDLTLVQTAGLSLRSAVVAAERLTGHRLWKRAQVIKANPDSPQTHARRLALEEGKTVVMAVPRLRDMHPFRVLDPRKLSKNAIREAATIKGALKHGRVVALEEIPEIDFVLCGSVAVNLNGARIGRL